jgi:hypothetical protein
MWIWKYLQVSDQINEKLVIAREFDIFDDDEDEEKKAQGPTEDFRGHNDKIPTCCKKISLVRILIVLESLVKVLKGL